MIALDTNVLVRFITEDDPRQAAASRALLATPGETFYVSDIVLVELSWVLRSVYRFRREEVGAVLRALLDRVDFVVADREGVQAAVRHLAAGGDLADALLLAEARRHGCARLATFDEELTKRDPGFALAPR